MSLSVNGHSRVPPGFRFHPTEEELLDYYLRKKAAHQMIDLDVISDVDLNKLEPWDIQEKCRIGSTPQNDWYFFSHKDKKYPTGTRTNRATAAGFWKATGRDKIIYSSFKRIGMRKTLVFYKGRAPHGQRSGWIMHEYRLDDQKDTNAASKASSWAAETAQEDGWVVCRVFKKKYLHKTQDSTYESSVTNEINTQMLHSSISDEPLDQILEYVGQKCKPENESNSNNNVRFLAPIEQTISTGVPEPFMQLPQLESPTLPRIKHISNQSFYTPVISDVDALTNNEGNGDLNPVYQVEAGVNNWATLDRLVACHLNGQADASQQLAFFNDLNLLGQDRDHLSPNICSLTNQLFNSSQDYNNDVDLWGFTHSAFDLHLN